MNYFEGRLETFRFTILTMDFLSLMRAKLKKFPHIYFWTGMKKEQVAQKCAEESSKHLKDK